MEFNRSRIDPYGDMEPAGPNDFLVGIICLLLFFALAAWTQFS